MEMMEKLKFTGVCLAILILISANSGIGLTTGSAWADDGGSWRDSDLVEIFIDEEGREVAKVIVPGRPPKVKATVVEVPKALIAAGTNSLSNVPAFDWSYGCSATSAAMLFGYYDRTGYANMYAGPANGGVCPMPTDYTIWGQTAYPGVTCMECPLSATHEGYDGLGTKGHVDDYWVDYNDPGPDPYIGNWTQHTHADCTSDFMGTSQSSYGNNDGSTTFYYWDDGSPLPDYIGCEPGGRDGCHGTRLFAESRGYTVTTNYSQLIKGQGSNPDLGFTFDNYKTEIDNGRPVLIHVTGHTMLGYGYNDTGNLVYLHDTWDYGSHSMTWGSTYSGLQHYGVSVIQLVPGATAPTVTNSTGASDVTSTSARLNGEVTSTGGEDPTVHICWGETDEGTTAVNWDTDVNLGTKGAGGFYTDIGSLTHGTTYYYRCYATNAAGSDWADSTASFTAGMVTLDRQVSQSSDDCGRLYSPTAYWSTAVNYQAAGRTVAAYPDYGGAFRLQNITIPKGATITQAYFSIKGRNSDSRTTVRSRIRAQAADNPATFSTSADFDARTWTGETVYWDGIPAWTAGNWYNSPDMKTIVQAIVNRANWQSGNALVICWDDWQKRSTQSDYRIRRGRSYNYAAADAPKLHIQYVERAEAPTVTNSTGATNITSASARLNGEVTDTGGENPTVHIYWGETDEGTTAGNWDNHVNDLGTKGAETFYEDISSLTASTTYYYRCYATNSNGNDWADSTESFATLAPPSAPTVTNSTGASSVTDSSARLNGEITSTGGEDPTVHIYWGDEDGETTAENWDNHVDDLGTKGAETFYEDISSLTASTTYYYRCYATSSGGNDWADSTESFGTLAEATTLDRQVSQSSDDCARLYHTDYWSTAVNYQVVGRSLAAYPDYGGAFRLQNITIPKGATITAAYFSVKGRNSDSGTTVRSRIRAQAADNPATFSAKADFDARTWTNETVYWDSIPAWTAGNWYNSPDIKTIVQAIVDRANWQSGNAIVICWEDWQKRSTQNDYVIRRGRSYNYAAADAPKLHVEYTTVPPDPPGAPTLVSPGASITFKWNASSGATKYHLRVNTLANFTGTNKFNDELGDVTSREVTGLSVGTTYYWRVKAGNDGGWSDWSSVRSVLAAEVL